jgi:hypothetical protein
MCNGFSLPSSVVDVRSELPQWVAAPQFDPLITETLHRLEMIAVNALVVLIGKRYSDPGTITPLVDAALYLLAFERKGTIGISISRH